MKVIALIIIYLSFVVVGVSAQSASDGSGVATQEDIDSIRIMLNNYHSSTGAQVFFSVQSLGAAILQAKGQEPRDVTKKYKDADLAIIYPYQYTNKVAVRTSGIYFPEVQSAIKTAITDTYNPAKNLSKPIIRIKNSLAAGLAAAKVELTQQPIDYQIEANKNDAIVSGATLIDQVSSVIRELEGLVEAWKRIRPYEMKSPVYKLPAGYVSRQYIELRLAKQLGQLVGGSRSIAGDALTAKRLEADQDFGRTPAFATLSTGFMGSMYNGSKLLLATSERARFLAHFERIQGKQMLIELYATSARVGFPDWWDEVVAVFGSDYIKEVSLLHHYRLELIAIANVGASASVVVGVGGDLEYSNNKLLYTNAAVPSRDYTMRWACINGSQSASAAADSGTEEDVGKATAAAKAQSAVAASSKQGSFGFQKLKDFAKEADIKFSPSFSFGLDQDQNDNFNSAELHTDKYFSPNQKIGWFPFMKAGSDISAQLTIISTGQASEITIFGAGTQAMVWNTGGSNQVVGLPGIKLNDFAGVSKSYYFAGGWCYGSEYTALNKPIPTFPNIGTMRKLTFDTPKQLISSYTFPANGSYWNENLSTDILNDVQAINSECPTCTVTYRVRSLYSGLWSSTSDPLQAEAQNDSPAQANIRSNLTLAEVKATVVVTALIKKLELVQALPETETSFLTFSELRALLTSIDRDASEVTNTTWHSLVQVELYLTDMYKDDYSFVVPPPK